MVISTPTARELRDYSKANLAAVDIRAAVEAANDQYTVMIDRGMLIDAERNSLWRDFVYTLAATDPNVAPVAGERSPNVEAYNVYLPWLGGRGLRRYDTQNPLQYSQLDVYNVTLSTVQWGDGFAVPRVDMRKDKLGFYSGVAEDLGRKAAEFSFLKFWEYMKTHAFTGAAPFGLAFDGAALLSASHPYKDANGATATFSNTGTAAFSESSYNAAVAQIRGYRMPNGDTLARSMRLHVVVGPSNEQTARNLFEAQYKASGASNVQLFPESWEINEELSGAFANYWYIFITSSSARHRPVFYVRDVEPGQYSQTDLSSDIVFERDEFRWRVELSEGFCPGMPTAIFGSTGAS